MKNILTAFAIFFLTTSAFAGNSFCNGKTGKSLNLCYRMAIENQRDQMNANLAAIRRADQPKKNMDNFNANQRDWEVQINNGCTTDAICVYDSQVSRNAWLKQQRKILGV